MVILITSIGVPVSPMDPVDAATEVSNPIIFYEVDVGPAGVSYTTV